MSNYRYLICSSVDPVEFGFSCRHLLDEKQFKGFGAFNQYFEMLTPDTNAKAIPDVWDGYYRITWVQFDSTSSPEKLREQLESFHPAISGVQMHELPFPVRKIDIAPECFRLGNEFAVEPIALYVTRPSGFSFDSVLEMIKRQINHVEWIKIPERWLHMNIRLYSNGANGNWTWRRIKKLGIPVKVGEHTIEFRHTSLQIIPSRETCKQVYERKPGNPWWMGVTELRGKCSGCQYTIEENEWKGVCPNCEQYERIKPIWSIPCVTKVINVFERNSVFAYLGGVGVILIIIYTLGTRVHQLATGNKSLPRFGEKKGSAKSRSLPQTDSRVINPC